MINNMVIKKVILEITQEDLQNHYQKQIDDEIQVILKPETLNRMLEKSVRDRIDELVKHHLNMNTDNHFISNCIKNVLKENLIYKKVIKAYLELQIKKIQKQIDDNLYL